MDNMGGTPDHTAGGNALIWSKEVTLLFSSWKTDTVAEYIFTLLAVFLLAILYQWLTSFRTILVSRFKAMKDDLVKDSADKSQDNLEAGSTKTVARSHPKAAKLFLVLLFGISTAIGYLLMLTVMGFNVGVYLAVVLGLTVAYSFSDL